MLVTVDNLSINPMTVQKIENAKDSFAFSHPRTGSIITMKNGDIIYLPKVQPHKLSQKLIAPKYINLNLK